MLPWRWCAAANVRRGSTPTALLRKRSTSQASGRASGAGWCPRTSVRCRLISATWCPWWRPSHHQSPLSVTTTGNSPGSWMRGKKPALNCWKKIVTSAHKLAPFSSLSSRALSKYPSRSLCQVFARVTNLVLSRSELKLWMRVSKCYVMTWTQTILTMTQHSRRVNKRWLLAPRWYPSDQGSNQ